MISSETVLWFIPLVIVLTTLLRSAIGFGDAIVAVPIMALAGHLTLGVSVMTSVGFAVTLMICLQDWKNIEWKAVSRLLIASIAGIPFGVAVLTWGNERLVLGGVGVVLIAFSLINLTGALKNVRLGPAWEVPFGFVSGVMGGAFNMFGLVLAIFGALSGWQPARFRLLASSFFLPTGVITLASQAAAGLWTRDFYLLSAIALVPSLAATELGRRINKRLNMAAFRTSVWVLILALGVALVLRNIG